ncbi:MAG TPA: DUF72 domain-containing protein [Clostridiales bacterium UBA8153]|nr:DUF72 domain-containing protein [Clostridiales bacterium UBA8153]
MIYVGTAGFKYADWKGVFYPTGTKDEDLLAYYATQFPVVELDFTYYRMPTARTMAGLERKSPDGFRFCVKANRLMTHERPAEPALQASFREFASALAPLAETGKLSCVLAQFPWSFKPAPATLAYVLSWPERLPGIRLVVEYRNAAWLTRTTFEAMRRHQLGYCCVDEPPLRGLVPPLTLATSELAYVRYHGRNAAKWWNHESAGERYDYLYSREELAEWIPRVRQLEEAAPETMLIFNNCHAGQAARNGRMLMSMLDAELFPIVVPPSGP